MKSPQESIIRDAIEHGWGSANLFHPDVVFAQAGKKTWEPADLVWFGRDCVALIFCTTLKRSPDSHNLTQASITLERWTSGEPIKGSNAFQHISLPYDSSKKVIVLSVIGGAKASEYTHINRKQCEKADLVITLPERVTTLMNRHFCNMTDFLRIAAVLYPLLGSIRDHEVILAVRTYLNSQYAATRILSRSPSGEDNLSQFNAMSTPIQKIILNDARILGGQFPENVIVPATSGPENLTKISQVMDDLPLRDRLILGLITDAGKRESIRAKKSAETQCDLDSALVWIIAAKNMAVLNEHIERDLNSGMKIFDRMKKLKKDLIILAVPTTSGPSMSCIGINPERRSTVYELIESIPGS